MTDDDCVVGVFCPKATRLAVADAIFSQSWWPATKVNLAARFEDLEPAFGVRL